MRHHSSVSGFSRLLVAAVAVLALAAPASAVPVAVTGSTYKVSLFQFSPTTSNLIDAPNIFDGLGQVFALSAGGTVTVTESQTVLDNITSRIDISFVSTNAELFPASLGGQFAGAQIGFNGDPLDFNQSVQLISATVTHTLGNGNVLFGPTQVVGSVLSPNPWNGFFTGPGNILGFSPSIGADVRRVDLSFTVQAIIPEPATATLGLLSLGGLLLRRRRTA